MNKVKENELFQISDKDFILCTSNTEPFLSQIEEKTCIIYFSERFAMPKIENKNIEKVFVVTKKRKKPINNNILNKLSSNIFIMVDMNDNFEYAKFVIKNIKKIFEGSEKNNIKLGQSKNEINIIALVEHNNSIYLNDLINAFKVISMKTNKEKYEFIYDNVCKSLDNEFYCKNICDFKDDKCIASRNGRSCHEKMGCCYSFEYAGLFDFRIVKNVKVCKYLQNKKCSTSNISCKLFTCRYLKEKNVCFDSHKILLLECFLNKKQHEIIKSNFFRTREEILDKLLENNKDTYLWYYIFSKYMINTKED